jgi:hypothetical protein
VKPTVIFAAGRKNQMLDRIGQECYNKFEAISYAFLRPKLLVLVYMLLVINTIFIFRIHTAH